MGYIGRYFLNSLYNSVHISDDHNSNSSELIASTKCVNNAVKEIKSSTSLPLGHIYLWPFSTPPDGSIQLNGSEYNRSLYSDLWALIQEKGWYKSESEWQSIASANGGYCPYYSDGDGSTTFRTPKFAPYQKLALASGNAGAYTAEGLPNITGMTRHSSCGIWSEEDGGGVYSGAFYKAGIIDQYLMGTYGPGEILAFDASRSNPIYGNSEHVTPESNDWIVCVVAFGTATNVGSVDVSNVMSAVGTVQADVESINEITDETNKRSSWKQISTRSTIGDWTITECRTDKPLIILSSGPNSSEAYVGIKVVSGAIGGDNDHATYGSYTMGRYSGTDGLVSTNCFICLPVSNVVVINIAALKGTLTAVQ